MTDRVATIRVDSDRAGRSSGKELLIAAIAVATVLLAVTNPGFVIIAICAGLAAAALLRFEFFVYALVFLLPWYPVLDAKPPFHDVFLLLRFALWGGVWVIRRQQGKSFKEWIAGSRLKKGVLTFAGVAVLSLLLSSQHANLAAYRSLVRLLSYVAVFYALVGWLESRRQVITIIKLILISTLGVALFGFYQLREQSYTDLYFRLYPNQEEALEPWVGRITSFLFHFNFLAGYLNLALPFAMACMIFARTRGLRILALICHSAAAAALFFTGSRGGLIAYGGMLFISFWFLKPRGKAVLRLCLSLILAAGLVVSLQERGGSARLQGLDDFTQETRLALWGTAGILFLNHPILGVGFGNYRSLYNDYLPGVTPDQLDAHNLYLQFLSETGMVGFVCFCIPMVGFARIALDLARRADPFDRLVGVGVGGALAATLIHGMVDYIFNASPQSGALLWLVLALGLLVYEQFKTGVQPPFDPRRDIDPRHSHEFDMGYASQAHLAKGETP
jgi:O-antigen ligase